MTQSLNNVAACDPPCVRQAVARLWPGATWSAEPLDGGMTNRNFKVEVQITDREQRTVVVQEQLPDALAARVGIHRENQVRAMAMVLDLTRTRTDQSGSHAALGSAGRGGWTKLLSVP